MKFVARVGVSVRVLVGDGAGVRVGAAVAVGSEVAEGARVGLTVGEAVGVASAGGAEQAVNIKMVNVVITSFAMQVCLVVIIIFPPNSFVWNAVLNWPKGK